MVRDRREHYAQNRSPGHANESAIFTEKIRAVRRPNLPPVLGAKSRAQTAPPAAQSAPVDTSPATLDHLLAPIALYPDALLMQVLAASLNSQEVLDGGNWLLEHKSLEGTQLDSAAKAAGFGAAMTALFRFPDVVDLMCTQLDWTRQLGAAFNADQAGVLASVQRLRAKAQQYGTLKSTPQQTVVTQQDNGKQVIVIQPANPQVIYVPQYNPQTVYVSSGPSTSTVVASSIISFGLGVAVGALFSSNNYYYPRWGYGGVRDKGTRRSARRNLRPEDIQQCGQTGRPLLAGGGLDSIKAPLAQP